MELTTTINTKDLFTTGEYGAVIAAVKAEVAKLAPDITTAKGRKEIASMAYSVSKTKNDLDKAGKEFVSGLKNQVALVDKVRRNLWDDLESIQKEVRAPLDSWEREEELRVSARENGLKKLEEIKQAHFKTVLSIEEALGFIQKLPQGEDYWQEFHSRFVVLSKEVGDSLFTRKVEIEEQAKKDAELEALRAEKEKRDQEERVS